MVSFGAAAKQHTEHGGDGQRSGRDKQEAQKVHLGWRGNSVLRRSPPINDESLPTPERPAHGGISPDLHGPWATTTRAH